MTEIKSVPEQIQKTAEHLREKESVICSLAYSATMITAKSSLIANVLLIGV